MYLQQKYAYQQTAQRKQNIAEAFSKKKHGKTNLFLSVSLCDSIFFKIV